MDCSISLLRGLDRHRSCMLRLQQNARNAFRRPGVATKRRDVTDSADQLPHAPARRQRER